MASINTKANTKAWQREYFPLPESSKAIEEKKQGKNKTSSPGADKLEDDPLKGAFARKPPFFSISQKMERVAFSLPWVSKWYFWLFYKRMLQKEVALARTASPQLAPGAQVLHVGSGAYPYTAIFLARQGYRVTARDCHPEAVKIARQVIQELQLEDYITLEWGEGFDQNTRHHYGAVWVSLNVHPKEEILNNALFSLKNGGVLIYRNLPRWLAFCCRSPQGSHEERGPLEEQGLDPNLLIKKERPLLGGESVLVKKPNHGETCPSGKFFYPSAVDSGAQDVIKKS